MSEQTEPTRGAAEEASGTPLTETEVEASRRPPSAPGGGSEGPGGPTDDAGPGGDPGDPGDPRP